MDVSVRLEEITEDNWRDIVLLTTEDSGMPRVLEQYVASNSLSIVQAAYEGTWTVNAVYCGKRPVGFVMYGYCREHDCYELCRLMIDHNHQGKGFGSIALKLVIEEMAEIEDCTEIYLSVNPENIRGKHIYEKAGFVKTGEVWDNEEVYCLHLM
ncbi:MAG: GNAT family N-acetyltransferase [Lachnospiraceae bacterium]|nr:GNAT family N-acetyltransferase [Lachnospiraceae bacterium]